MLVTLVCAQLLSYFLLQYQLQMAKKDKDDRQKRLYKLAAWSRR